MYLDLLPSLSSISEPRWCGRYCEKAAGLGNGGNVIRFPSGAVFCRTPFIRLIASASHPDMQKIQVIGFFLENRLHLQFEVPLLLLQYVPTSKPFDYA